MINILFPQKLILNSDRINTSRSFLQLTKISVQPVLEATT